MRRNNDYYKFYTKFLYLVCEAKISEEDYKFELNSKLAFELQRAVVTNYISLSSFIEFSDHCL